MVGRVVLGVGGVLLLLGGLAAGGAAAWTSAVFGSDGALRIDTGTITPAPGTIATLIDVERFGASVPYLGSLGRTSLSVTSGDTGDPSDTMFIGAAGTAAVDAYLRGTPYSVAIREGDDWTVRAVPGTSVPPLPRRAGPVDHRRRGPTRLDPGARGETTLACPDAPLRHPEQTSWRSRSTSRCPGSPRGSCGCWSPQLSCIAGGVVLLVLALRRRRGRGRHAAAGTPATGAEVADDALVG